MQFLFVNHTSGKLKKALECLKLKKETSLYVIVMYSFQLPILISWISFFSLIYNHLENNNLGLIFLVVTLKIFKSTSYVIFLLK